MKARQLMAVLRRKPLEYAVERQEGSHKALKSGAGYPPLEFSWHDGATIPPGLVKKVLVKDVGLSEEDALKLL